MTWWVWFIVQVFEDKSSFSDSQVFLPPKLLFHLFSSSLPLPFLFCPKRNVHFTKREEGKTKLIKTHFPNFLNYDHGSWHFGFVVRLKKIKIKKKGGKIFSLFSMFWFWYSKWGFWDLMARSRSSSSKLRYCNPSYYLKRPKRLALLFIAFVCVSLFVWDRQTLVREHEVTFQFFFYFWLLYYVLGW